MSSRRTILGLAAVALALPAVAEAQGIKTVRYLNQETDPAVATIHRQWIEDFVAQNPAPTSSWRLRPIR